MQMHLLNAAEHRSMQSVFDCDITEEERAKLGLPAKEEYLQLYEGERSASTMAHLALLFHLHGVHYRRAEFIKRLPTDKFNKVMNRMFELK